MFSAGSGFLSKSNRRSRSCAGTTGANPKPGLGADISGLGSKCDSKLRSVTGEEEVCIGAGTKGGLPEAFREPLPRAFG